MSSEMRGSKFTNEDLETISRTWNSNKYTEHTAMLLASELLRARALLARTEAGPSLLCQSDACAHKGTAHNFCTPRTEAGADGAIYQMMATDEDVDEDGNVRPDDPRLWMDHSREEYERLKNHPSVRSRIVYTRPQDASGDAVDWKWQYRFQTVMRFMDNGATREAAERAALIDIAELENAAMQAKEAK